MVHTYGQNDTWCDTSVIWKRWRHPLVLELWEGHVKLELKRALEVWQPFTEGKFGQRSLDKKKLESKDIEVEMSMVWRGYGKTERQR